MLSLVAFFFRWLLLNFKREFDYKEALRLFEITSSRHLEVSSLEAEMERYKERAKEFENNSMSSPGFFIIRIYFSLN